MEELNDQWINDSDLTGARVEELGDLRRKSLKREVKFKGFEHSIPLERERE